VAPGQAGGQPCANTGGVGVLSGSSEGAAGADGQTSPRQSVNDVGSRVWTTGGRLSVGAGAIDTEIPAVTGEPATVELALDAEAEAAVAMPPAPSIATAAAAVSREADPVRRRCGRGRRMPRS
jgi:hypothetical protein